MARNGARLLAVLGALAWAPCAAQPVPASQADDTIVVTGKTEAPPTGKEFYEQARDISRLSRYQLYEEALPRFQAPLCPGVVGLETGAAEAMIDRIRANGTRLGVRLATEGCSPNLIVAFVEDGQALLASLQQSQPQMFRLVAESERDELTAAAPVRVWTNIVLRWTGAGPPPRDWPRERASVWGQLDRTSMPEAKDIVSALVVFDRNAVIGLTLAQLADYATMRGLTHTRPAGGSLDTILAMFPGGVGPAELTSFDIGYLQSLYQGAANRPAANKFVGIRRLATAQRRRTAGH